MLKSNGSRVWWQSVGLAVGVSEELAPCLLAGNEVTPGEVCARGSLWSLAVGMSASLSLSFLFGNPEVTALPYRVTYTFYMQSYV